MAAYDDPLESADNPEIQLPRYYGQAVVDAYFAVLVKGVGKVPFDPGQHTLDKRVTAIKLGILPLAEQNVTKDIYREYIAEFSNGAWVRITHPSLKALGLTVKSLNGAWVCLELVSEGRTYTSKEGETRDSLTFKVIAHYADEAACKAAYLNQTVSTGQEPAAISQAPATTPTNGNGHNGNGTDKEKATALQFVKSLITATAGDEAALSQRIATIPQIAKHFTVQSSEVRALLDAWQFDQLQKAA